MDSVFRTPQVHLIGEIIGATGFSDSKLYCRVRTRQWRLHCGTDWRLLTGKDSGETFYDNSENLHDLAVFEHPIEAQYACKTIMGWPKLVAEVWTVDAEGRHSIGGYGVLTFPVSPGEYELNMAMWRPEGSAYDRALSYFLGANPELKHKDVVLSGNDRFGMQTVSTGNLQVRVGVIVKDFHLHGISLKA